MPEQENNQLLQPNNNANSNVNMPEVLTSPIYTPGFLKQQIGKLMRVEFLIGTNTLVDRIGVLYDVGASYILLRSFEGDSFIYADIYSIKFITISNNQNVSQNLNMNYNNQFYSMY